MKRAGSRPSTGSPGALVIGGNIRALGIARSLGRRGIRTWLLRVPRDDQVARASRYVERTLRAPSGNAEQQCEGLLAIAAAHRLNGWTLFPTEDECAGRLSRQHDRLSTSFGLTFPGWDVFRTVYHKRLLHGLTEVPGVQPPWTRYPTTVAELQALQCRFPLILKPDAKPYENPFTRDKAWAVGDSASLISAWKAATALVGVDGVMVQELIPGNAQYSYAALCHDGVPIASLVARRRRQYPRDFGHSSSLVETIDAPDIEGRGRSVLKALGWTGLAEVEFKHDPRDGSYKLLDINGRVWTWHGIGPLAGVDFPYLAWRLAQGLPVGHTRARAGVRWVRLVTDLPSAVGSVRAGELSLPEWRASLRAPRTGAVLAFDDPIPPLADPFLLTWRSLASRLQGLRRIRPTSSKTGDHSHCCAAPEEFARSLARIEPQTSLLTREVTGSRRSAA